MLGHPSASHLRALNDQALKNALKVVSAPGYRYVSGIQSNRSEVVAVPLETKSDENSLLARGPREAVGPL